MFIKEILFCYYQPSEDGKYNEVYVVSESDIRKNYYPEWQEKMIKKYGKIKFEENFNFDDCISDWCLINGAWKV